MIETEAAIVAKRIQRESVTRAVLTRLAILSTPNQSVKTESTRKAAKQLEKLMKEVE